jgi:hypothetical protein
MTDNFKEALGEEAYGVFGRTGLTPSQLADELRVCNERCADWCFEYTKVRDAAKAMIEIDDRDALTDPGRAATDEHRAEAWANLRAAISHN